MENKINLLELTQQFIQSELNGDAEKVQSKNDFLIYYLGMQISQYVNHDDINQLKDIFVQYCYVCLKYSILPSAKMYCILIGLDYTTYNNWRMGINVSSDYTLFANTIHNTCMSLIENKLSNSEQTRVNLMFISKAVYGYTETAPIQRIEKIDIQVNDIKSITNRYGNIKAIECDDN